MTTAIIVLALVAAVVALSILRPGDPAAAYPGAYRDRDQERHYADLRAIAAHQPDPSTWNSASRAASASTSRSTSRESGWNGSQCTSAAA
ncbi:hypothetical protein GCM10009559_21600 [Pseudonocardia zijingensis]|uniref:Uncharacterized protein n=1 Tax=Pseudonocardia zijingensis TaxID=153376 RepID=A0ABN1PTP0_9PSEU